MSGVEHVCEFDEIEHVCEFDEVEIEQANADDILKVGMKVLVPCRQCGETPLDNWDFLKARDAELTASLLNAAPDRPLYHWAPTSRRKQILRHGLRPAMRATTSSIAAPYVCFGDSPSWAWALSGGQRNVPTGSWDLWQTWLDRVKPVLLATPDRPSGIHEIRAEHRIYKRDLWYVGSREKL